MMRNPMRALTLCVVVGVAIWAGAACKKSDWSALEKSEVKPNLQKIFEGAKGFEISDPHRFQYRFLSSGSGLKARFVVRALAWDPKTKAWVVFERRATVSSEYRVVGSEKLWSDKKVKDLKKLDTPAHLGFALDSQAVTDCKAFGFIPQRAGGVVVFKARRASPVTGKGAAHCKQVWKKACGGADFAKRHVKPCKLAAK